MIYKKCRLFKGIEEYKDLHKVTFDIETRGLRYETARIFAIGIKDNRSVETILLVDKLDDDESERKLIREFFDFYVKLKPAVICGYNSEMFDFDFIVGRAKILEMNLGEFQTTLRENDYLKRKAKETVKIGGTAEKYTATSIWGISVIDILHAVKRTSAVNSEIKENKLKYIAKFENIAKPNRTYIDGSDNDIYNFYAENKIFAVNDKNEYLCVPDKYQETAVKMCKLQVNKSRFDDAKYKSLRNNFLTNDKEFVNWFKTEAMPKNMTGFINGKKLMKQYLLDDLWETEKVDELYNQSSFMLAKIVPTSYHRICTMGTAGIWNLLMTAWSYEKNIAIPDSDVYEHFSGGLARCYKTGYSERIVKIDYDGMYPHNQLTNDVFPIFDITGVMKMLLLYLTTTRAIYKKLANSNKLNEEELFIVKSIDTDTYTKYVENKLTPADRAMFKIKQLPIKILNNSQFGALGSNVSFNWSDNECAARITCIGRLLLRQAIWWFNEYNCEALLAVTDGINFQFPIMTKIQISQNKNTPNTLLETEIPIEEAWKYNSKIGIDALIEKFNKEEMKPPFNSVDNDGEYLSCLNLSRINYATLLLAKDKKTGEMKEKIKLTGNTIKSKVMPKYIEEFFDKGLNLILHGKGKEFFEYYIDYAQNIYYRRIPLMKIASKSRVKTTIAKYQKRGVDKNGREKGKQAHMELLIEKRNVLAEQLFEEHKNEFELTKDENKLTLDDKYELVANYLPPEPELDSVVFHVNTGYKLSDGSSNRIKDNITGLERYASNIITASEMKENPNMLGEYNVAKYLNSFNKCVKSILVGFGPDVKEVAKNMLCKIVKTSTKDMMGGKVKQENLSIPSFDKNEDALQLKNFNKDSYNDSMFLEKYELNFWNKYGHDPRKIWNGFKELEDNRVYYEIYDDVLNYLNNKMQENNKPLIKSINDDYVSGDYVLLKRDFNFSVGKYDGICIKIIKENVDVPKSDLQIKLEEKQAIEQQRLKDAKENVEKNDIQIFADKKEKEDYERRSKYLPKFLEQENLNSNFTLEFLAEIENAIDKLDDYILEQEMIEDNSVAEYGVEDIDE
jgi:DNA polymerase elongation subunit (family B)